MFFYFIYTRGDSMSRSITPPHVVRQFKDLLAALRLTGIKAWVTPSDRGIWQQTLDITTPVQVMTEVIKSQLQRMGDCLTIRINHNDTHILWNVWTTGPELLPPPKDFRVSFGTMPK